MTKALTALLLSAALAGPAAAFTPAPLGPVVDLDLKPQPLGETLTPELAPLPSPFPGWILPDEIATPEQFLA